MKVPIIEKKIQFDKETILLNQFIQLSFTARILTNALIYTNWLHTCMDTCLGTDLAGIAFQKIKIY